MGKSNTVAGVVPAAIVEEARQELGASFERFCLTAGIATLAGMMEADAARLCGVRYGRDDGRNGHRWGRTNGKLGFHGGKVALDDMKIELHPAVPDRAEIEKPPIRSKSGQSVLRRVEITCSKKVTENYAMHREEIVRVQSKGARTGASCFLPPAQIAIRTSDVGWQRCIARATFFAPGQLR